MTPCDDCGRTTGIMVAMEPGPDGKPWGRCITCHIQGLKTRSAA